ncbi:MAG: winged helix-turn-helix domain-containing protein [Myxococcales bacterium]|nr:winged helix-turn-helix domain-containing protein [Myxococcales bacterium]
MRRYLRRPHLAVRILSALARYAPAPWHPWIAWELLFAGESELALALLESGVASPVAELARGLVGALAGFEQGDLDGASSATAALEAAAGGWAFFADELGLVAAALDPRRNPGEVRSKRFQRWATGQSVELPPELHGIAVRAHGPRAHGGDSTAVVLVSPTAPARRLLWVSVATAQSLGYTMLAPTERGQARVHYGLAVLAFAGRTGLSAEELYREIYRLSFEPKADSRTLDVLVHRMRAVLPEGVQIRRERDGNLWLESSAPIVIPDPRCEQSTHDRVLRVLAKRPGLGAKDVAETLQISLRSAQETLKELAEDGACALQNEGKAHRYEVIDTTFTEPTVS